jgi:microcystin-dependent protein
MAMPIGTVANYCFDTTPTASDAEPWLMCDGSVGDKGVLSLNDYDPLWEVIGEAFGGGAKGGKFNLPDLRGRFVRACDKSPTAGRAGIDTDPRSAVAEGGNTSTSDSTVGSVQHHLVGPHAHGLLTEVGSTGTMNDILLPLSGPAHFFDSSGGQGAPDPKFATAAAGGSETRPINIALPFMILAASPIQRAPLGTIVAFAGRDEPQDKSGDNDKWLICDGQTITKSDYGAFVAGFVKLLRPLDEKGESYALPDLRGSFLRGGNPPGTDSKAGKPSGPLGSIVDPALGAHSHPLPTGYDDYPLMQGSDHYLSNNWMNGLVGGKATQATGAGIGRETRPVNANLHFIIRVK